MRANRKANKQTNKIKYDGGGNPKNESSKHTKTKILNQQPLMKTLLLCMAFL